MTCKHDGGQGHHKRSDPQSIAYKHNSCVERVSTEFEPNSVLREKKEWSYQWADNYDVLNNNSYTPTKGKKMGGFHIFKGDTSVFNFTKTKHNRKSKTRIVSEVSTSNKSDFYISKRQL